MENVRIAILSANDSVCAFLDNSVDNALHYYDDTLHTYLQGSQYTFEFKTYSQHDDSQYLVEGNHVSFRYNNHDYYCTIVQVEKDEREINVVTYGLTLELTNETVGSHKAESQTFEQYVKSYGFENTFSIGVNEVSDKKLSYEWTSTDTILARLFSIATLFDAELEFITELNDDYSLKQITMNVYREHDDGHQGMGEDKSHNVIRYGQNIDGITKKSDITELYTAIRPTGKDGLNLTGLGEKKEYDSNGVLEYYLPNGGMDIQAYQAREKFPSLAMGADGDRWIVNIWEYDTDNVNTLYGQALAQLKKNCSPQMEYDVDGYIDGNIGDTFTIEDTEFKPTLYLEARIVEQEISFTNPMNNKTTLDNFTELESEVSDSLLAQMQKLIDESKQYQLVVATDNGLVLPEDIDSTTITAMVKDKGQDVTSKFTIDWYLGDGLVNTGTTKTVFRDDIITNVVYRIVATIDGVEHAETEITINKVENGESVSIASQSVEYVVSESGSTIPSSGWSTTVPDVEKGKYLWSKTSITYSNGQSTVTYSKAYQGEDGLKGADGTSPTITSTVNEFVQSTSGTTQPTSGWSTTPPTAIAGQYMWTKCTITYSDGKTSTSYSVVKNGTNGVSPTVTSTSNQYCVSDSGVDVPTDGWQGTPPTDVKGKYIWTKSIVKYSDGKEAVTYAVSYQGADGSDGKQGEDGVGFSSIKPMYYLSTSNDSTNFVEVEGHEWTDTIPSTSELSGKDSDGKNIPYYVWEKFIMTMSDGTTKETEPTLYGMYTDINDAINTNANAIATVSSSVTTTINQAKDSILTQVRSDYVLQDSLNEYKQQMESSIQQTNSSITTTISELNQVSSKIDGLEQTSENVNSYMKFSTDGLELGKSDSQFKTNITNDRMSFTQNGNEVAYFSNNKMYVTDGEFTNSLHIGKFAFVPRANGSLDFKKVSD